MCAVCDHRVTLGKLTKVCWCNRGKYELRQERMYHLSAKAIRGEDRMLSLPPLHVRVGRRAYVKREGRRGGNAPSASTVPPVSDTSALITLPQWNALTPLRQQHIGQ